MAVPSATGHTEPTRQPPSATLPVILPTTTFRVPLITITAVPFQILQTPVQLPLPRPPSATLPATFSATTFPLPAITITAVQFIIPAVRVRPPSATLPATFSATTFPLPAIIITVVRFIMAAAVVASAILPATLRITTFQLPPRPHMPTAVQLIMTAAQLLRLSTQK